MKLTPSAHKTFYCLFLGCILISLIGLILYQHLIPIKIHPQLHSRVINKINQVAHRLQKNPSEDWPNILRHLHERRLQFYITSQAIYKKKVTLPFHPNRKTLNLPKGLRLSIPLKDKQWLNVSLTPSARYYYRYYLPLLALGILWLGGLGILCRWAINRLDTPMKQLIENLDYANQQEQWQSIPLVGNEEQNIIFAKINGLQARVNKLLSARTHMLAAISHDLRTPLTRIKLRAEYFQNNAHYPKLLADINEMELMISESLQYFQDINHEEGEQSFDLLALLSALCEDAQDLGYDVKFTCSGLEKVIYNGRLNLLKRAFNNVLHNAINYGKQARVSIEQSDNSIKITIDDEGPGLDETILEHAFTPFYRGETSRSRQTGGTGLGLGIAKEIIQLHGGSIRLINRPEGGLRATIRL